MQIAGSTYVLRFSLFAQPQADDAVERGLVIPGTPVLKLDPSLKLYHDILQKTTRYGELSEPFMIAVWDRHAGRERPELAALYGTAQWTLRQEVQRPRAYESRLRDGIFNALTDEGNPRYVQLSAVAFIRSSGTGGSVDDSLVVYHNPFAALPLDSSILSDFCQYIRDGDQMKWISGRRPVE